MNSYPFNKIYVIGRYVKLYGVNLQINKEKRRE